MIVFLGIERTCPHSDLHHDGYAFGASARRLAVLRCQEESCSLAEVFDALPMK